MLLNGTTGAGIAIPRRPLLACILAATTAAVSLPVAAAPLPEAVVGGSTVQYPECPGQVGAPQLLYLSAGKSKFMNLGTPVTRLTVGSDSVAHAKLVSPTALYLFGNAVGTTNMILQAKDGSCTVLDVLVQLDPAPLKATLDAVMPGEKDLIVGTAGDSIVLSGMVSSAIAAEQVAALAESYVIRTARNLDAVGSGSGAGTRISLAGNGQRTKASTLVVNMMSVAAPQQVMLEVKVAEVSKTVLDQFGINFSRAFALADGTAIKFLNGLLGGQKAVLGQIAGTVGATVGGGVIDSVTNGSATAALTGPVGNASLSPSNPTIPLAAGKNVTTLGLDAQKQDGLVKVLAEPTVMAISGQQGSFLAGGKIFIPVVQNNGSGAVTYTLEEKEFGVSLRFRPTVLGDGRINLEVNPEVSELSATGVTITSSATGATTVLPAFTTRKAATTVQLFDGQSFAIGGLMKNNVTGNVNAFPILGELPVIGALFRSTSFQTDRSELVFVVTPRLVKPLPPNYALPTDKYIEPTRAEVILGGKLEGAPLQADIQPPPRASVVAPAAGGGFELK